MQIIYLYLMISIFIKMYEYNFIYIYNFKYSISMISTWAMFCSGVKKSLVLVPGTSWISGRTSIYFHPMSGGQVKNSMLVYFSLTRTSYLVTGQVKILMDLPGGQVKIFRFFYPCCSILSLIQGNRDRKDILLRFVLYRTSSMKLTM